jgi:hypothetical protein
MEATTTNTCKLLKRRGASYKRKEAGYYFVGLNPTLKRGSILRQLDGYHQPILNGGFGWRSKFLGVWEGV